MQDVLLQAFTKLDTLRGRTRVRPWLLKITKRKCIDVHRPWESGRLRVRSCCLTVLHNGVVIHDKYVLPSIPLEEADSQSKERAKGPIFLQDHGIPVRYRNIWVVERE